MTNRFTTTYRQATRLRHGFTLVEMLIVVALISLLAILAVPSFISMFNAGAEHQAYNAVSALLTSARAHALKTNSYVAVHFQPADRDGSTRGDLCHAALLTYNPATKQFESLDPILFRPVALPAGVGVGQLSDQYIEDVGGGDSKYIHGKLVGTEPYEFMTFTIVFSPQGIVVPKADGQTITFDTTSPTSYFFTSGASVADKRKKLWNASPGYTLNGQEGVRALTIFNRNKIEPLTAQRRADHLTDSAPFLPVNCYTGQLFPR